MMKQRDWVIGYAGLALMLAGVLTGLAGCTEGPGGAVKLNGIPTTTVTIGPSTIPVSTVTVTPQTLKLGIGESSSLNADLLPKNATNPTVVWSSNDEDVATVDPLTGEVRSVRNGVAMITATADGISDTCMVTVK